MSRRTCIQAIFLFAVAAGWETAAPADDAEIYRQVVADSAAKYLDAYAKRDAAGLAALFTPEAEYVDATGTIFHGRAAIEAELAASFEAGEPGKLELDVTSIRPIAEGVLIEEGASTFRPERDGPVSQSRYLALHVRQSDGSWLMAAVRELAPPDLSAHEQLKSLAWLVGPWREEAEGGVMKTTWRWSDDDVALLAEFTVKDREGSLRRGTHRVGWDAQRKQFRSWIFDSSGGFAEGFWTPAADGSWSVRLQGVSAEGESLGALLTYVRDGTDRLTISQTQRILAGEAIPDVVGRVVRAPPEPTLQTQK